MNAWSLAIHLVRSLMLAQVLVLVVLGRVRWNGHGRDGRDGGDSVEYKTVVHCVRVLWLIMNWME